MTVNELLELLDQPSDLHFGRVRNKRTSRSDLQGLILLDELAPSDDDILAGASTKTMFLGVNQTMPRIVTTFYLNVDLYVLAAAVTPEQVEDLVRCGVYYDEESKSLVMSA